MVLILIVFMLCINSAEAGFTEHYTARKLPEQAKWQLGDQVISDPDVVNIDVVSLNDGGFRAYYMYTDGIRSMLSNDEGLSFTLEDGLRMSNAQHHALIKLPDGRIRMYYSTGSSGGVLSAISSDGLNFTQEEGLRLALGSSGEADAGAIIHPVVIALADGSGYRIYYDSDSKNNGDTNNWLGIRSAFSEDGLNFTKDTGFRVAATTNAKFASLVWSPFVEYDADDELYKLYFSVESSSPQKNGAYIATSANGLDFKIVKKAIIKRDPRLGPNSPGVGGWPGLPQDIFIINVTDGKRLYYWSAGNHGIYNALLED